MGQGFCLLGSIQQVSYCLWQVVLVILHWCLTTLNLNSLEHFIVDQAMHWYCFDTFTFVHRKVFIDRSGVEILCSLLKPSTRVFQQDQMFELWMFDILTFTFRCLSMAQEHPLPFLASSWMNGYLTLHIHNLFVF